MEYVAHAFHKQFKNGRTSGTLTCSGQEFIFSWSKGRMAIPSKGTVLRLGGASNRLVFLSHPDRPEYSFYTSDHSILNDPKLNQCMDLARQIEAIRTHRLKNRLITFGVAVCLLLLMASPFLFIQQMAGIAARRIPARFEREIGEKLIAQYQFDHDIMADEKGKAALREVGAPLLAQLKTTGDPFKVYVSKNPQINAFALPGGFIVVNSGLIQAADSAEELLGVMAHEVIHVTEKHGLRNVISSAGIILVAQAVIGDAAGLMATVAGAAPLLLNQHYSREFEREADEKGYHLLIRSGIDPRGMLRFFKHIQAEESRQLEKIGNQKAVDVLKKARRIFGTHPDTAERIERLEDLVASRTGQYHDFSAPFEQLKSAVTDFVTQTHQTGNDTHENRN